jgi:hypothetical protein
LLWYFDIFAGFWATSWKTTITFGFCMAPRTSGPLRIPWFLAFLTFWAHPFHSRHSSRKIPRHSPQEILLEKSHTELLIALSCLLNSLYSFFHLSLFTFSLVLSPMFGNFLGPWLNFQHCTSILIIIQFTGKGKIMAASSQWPRRGLCAFLHHLQGWAESGFISMAPSQSWMAAFGFCNLIKTLALGIESGQMRI